jgi:NTP pyrophosphatase (non-canonical NTP hydrolase)
MAITTRDWGGRRKMRDMNDYQEACRQFAVYPGRKGMSKIEVRGQEMMVGNYVGLVYVGLGISGEAGEVSDKIKKILRDHNGCLTSERREALLQEAGDVFWYLSSLADELGATLEEIASMNIRKLTDRKERGKIGGEGDKR